MTRTPRHGTASEYANYRCRCPECRAAHAEQTAKERQNRNARMTLDPFSVEHGQPTTYVNWGCRCPECKRAHAEKAREYRQRRRDELHENL